MMPNKKEHGRKLIKKQEWALITTILFFIGFFGIHEIVIKNLFIYPLIGDPIIHILGIRIEVDGISLNMLGMIWGATLWNTGKRVIF